MSEKLKYDPRTMKIVENGDGHAIVSVPTGGKILNGPDAGQPSCMYGVLVKETGCLWRSKLYYGYSGNSFVADRFDKLEYAYREKHPIVGHA